MKKPTKTQLYLAAGVLGAGALGYLAGSTTQANNDFPIGDRSAQITEMKLVAYDPGTEHGGGYLETGRPQVDLVVVSDGEQHVLISDLEGRVNQLGDDFQSGADTTRHVYRQLPRDTTAKGLVYFPDQGVVDRIPLYEIKPEPLVGN